MSVSPTAAAREDSVDARLSVSGVVVLALLVASLGVVGYADGFYEPGRRLALGVVVWWALAVGLATRVLPVQRRRSAAALVAVPLACFSLWTLLSATWSANGGQAVEEGLRTLTYLAVFALAALASSPRLARAWVYGLTGASSAVVLVALLSRFFPQLFPGRGLLAELPAVGGRLSFPLGYWNAVGATVALAAPLLVGCAAGARTGRGRAVAVALLPAAGAAVYLASSRGGLVAAVVGVAVVVALAGDRWAAAGASATGAVGSFLAVAVLQGRQQLVNGPLTDPRVLAQGHGAFALTLPICVASGIVFAVLARAFGSRRRPPRALGIGLVALLAVAAIGVAASAHPGARLDELRQPPGAARGADFASSHLFSGAGNGRWQFWTAALDEFRAHPLAGGGAGSYEAWWLQHGSFRYQVQDAHSLYAETLGELGLVGFALLIFVLCGGAAVSARAILATRGSPSRALVAGLVGCVVAYFVDAGVDWLWEIPFVTIVPLVALGLVAGPAFRTGRVRERARSRGAALSGAVAALAFAAFTGLVLVVQLSLAASRSAAATRPAAAWSAAAGAERLAPWSAEPALQLALLAEQSGRLALGRRWVVEATGRAPDEWQLWLIAARIETKQGDVSAAKASYARARTLDPRSPLFVNR